jgi:hypothetical protein
MVKNWYFFVFFCKKRALFVIFCAIFVFLVIFLTILGVVRAFASAQAPRGLLRWGEVKIGNFSCRGLSFWFDGVGKGRYAFGVTAVREESLAEVRRL